MTNAERREKIQEEAKQVIAFIQETEQKLAQARAYLERLGGKLDLLNEQEQEAKDQATTPTEGAPKEA